MLNPLASGNYGNKLDKHVPAQASTTPPTNPVYDGNQYYYLPWLDQKPCVVIDSHWEDNLYRIESMNLLNFIADRLVSSHTHTHIHTIHILPPSLPPFLPSSLPSSPLSSLPHVCRLTLWTR